MFRFAWTIIRHLFLQQFKNRGVLEHAIILFSFVYDTRQHNGMHQNKINTFTVWSSKHKR